MAEEIGEMIAKILNLCESNPDAGLELIERTIKRSPEAASNPLMKFAKTMAYGGKGLFQLARSKPEIDFTGFGEEELRDDLGVTDTNLDYIEKGLQEIKEMEEIYPGALKKFGPEAGRMAKLKVDVIAMVLERCRPGRVQEILGKTKLSYFGPGRVSKRNECDITRKEFEIFRDVFFTCDKTAKSALISLDGRDSQGRRYVAVALYKERKIFNKWGEQSSVAGFVCLYNDRTFTSGPLPPPASSTPSEHIDKVGEKLQAPEKEGPKKKGFFKKLFI